MKHKAVKVRIYPNQEQVQILAQHFGCARWWWNYALNQCIETYKETGKGLKQSALNSMLPKLKKQEETKWLKDCYSQVLQSVSFNLSRAYQNFFVRVAWPTARVELNTLDSNRTITVNQSNIPKT